MSTATSPVHLESGEQQITDSAAQLGDPLMTGHEVDVG